ncbi:hypothetical protein SLE2022_326370 [Rubroshorea leprosula]
METKDEILKSPIAISCAKAAMLLSSLKSSPNYLLESTNNDEDEEKEMMKREIGHLRLELTRERLKRRRIKLCGLMELILQVVVLMISSFFLILAFKSS